MQWCQYAWNSVSKETIANCFKHTKLFEQPESSDADDATEQTVQDDHDLEVTEELSELLKTVHGDEYSIDDIDILPAEETQGLHATMSTDELVNQVMMEKADGSYRKNIVVLVVFAELPGTLDDTTIDGTEMPADHPGKDFVNL